MTRKRARTAAASAARRGSNSPNSGNKPGAFGGVYNHSPILATATPGSVRESALRDDGEGTPVRSCLCFDEDASRPRESVATAASPSAPAGAAGSDDEGAGVGKNERLFSAVCAFAVVMTEAGGVSNEAADDMAAEFDVGSGKTLRRAYNTWKEANDKQVPVSLKRKPGSGRPRSDFDDQALDVLKHWAKERKWTFTVRTATRYLRRALGRRVSTSMVQRLMERDGWRTTTVKLKPSVNTVQRAARLAFADENKDYKQEREVLVVHVDEKVSAVSVVRCCRFAHTHRSSLNSRFGAWPTCPRARRRPRGRFRTRRAAPRSCSWPPWPGPCAARTARGGTATGALGSFPLARR